MINFCKTIGRVFAAAAVTAFLSASLSARPVPPHHFRLDSLREPLSVVSVVQERDGGTLEVILRDADGKQDGCEFNYKLSNDRGPTSAFGRLYVDEWLVPLGSSVQEKVARAVRRYVAERGQQDYLASRLASAVVYLEQLQKPKVTVSFPLFTSKVHDTVSLSPDGAYTATLHEVDTGAAGSYSQALVRKTTENKEVVLVDGGWEFVNRVEWRDSKTLVVTTGLEGKPDPTWPKSWQGVKIVYKW